MVGENLVLRANADQQFTPTATVDTAFNGALLCSKKWLSAYVAVLLKQGYRDPIEYEQADDASYTLRRRPEETPTDSSMAAHVLKRQNGSPQGASGSG